MRLGIFGGTFNPIHIGHLVLAEMARETLRLDRVMFIPTGRPPHKSIPGLLPGVTRLKLVQLAIQDHPAFEASSIEITRPGPSYTINTVRWLHDRWPRAKLFLLIGQDMLTVRWFAWNEIKRLCTVVAASRPSTARPSRQRGVTWLAMPPMAVTSSDIRARVAAGRSIRYLVPSQVERFIRRHRLYQA